VNFKTVVSRYCNSFECDAKWGSGCMCTVRLELYVLERVIVPGFRVHEQSWSCCNETCSLVWTEMKTGTLEVWLPEYQEIGKQYICNVMSNFTMLSVARQCSIEW
jgi:hypothetical protein